MTTIRNFFSPTKTSLAMTPSPVKTVKSEPKPIPAKPDNKLIVSNMKSVINSVKLHKKHKKRKRNVDEAPEIHDISNILQSNLSFISPNRTEPHQQINKENSGELTVTATAEEKSIASPIIVSEDSTKENTSINENATTTSSSQSVEAKSQSASNAFEFMMTARYKSIGTNSPGKERANKDVQTPETDREVNVRRKLMLEEWADRKGRAKKRQNEAADDEYIDVVMEKRAKRLRTLLTNGKKQKEVEISDEETVLTKPKNGLKIRLTKGKNRIEDSDDDDSHRTSTKTSKRSVNGKIGETNSATDEIFVEHLSSPLKKRDSLLGYFSKLTKAPSADASPNAAAAPDISINGTNTSGSKNKTKKRGRPRKSLPVEPVPDKHSRHDDSLQHEPVPAEKPVTVPDKVSPTLDQDLSPSVADSSNPLSEGRPKRLCRDKKISYLIEECYTIPKCREKKAAAKECTTPKATAKHSKPTKLAPIFAKSTPKPLIDPTVLRARQEFLMSGIPEKMKLEIEKQRQFEEFYETEFDVFPKISHVGHHTEPDGCVDVDLSKMNIRFRPGASDDDDEAVAQRFGANDILKVHHSSSNQEHSESKANPTTVYQKDLMRQLKQNDATDFPYFRCFKQLSRKNTTDPVHEDADGDCSIELVVEKVASANGNELFTEKYRPLSSSEVLLNTKPLIELQKFLSSWKENMDGRDCADSSDEFETNSNSGMSSANKAIVLTGPPGCGKTMFVYALANEMNFKVLEINAGARRTGKKVLKKLQEATQSHHVNSNQCSQGDRSKNVRSKYHQSEDSEADSGAAQMSLILVEDAEVVFEEDFGFVESINQLVTTTKRPVILITNQINCPHLSRFINRNMLLFRLPKPPIASKWLSTLSVAEQCYVTEDMCRTLYQRNNCDFRKTLLELQFFIHSTNRTHDTDAKSVMYTGTKLRDLFFTNQNRPDGIVTFPIDFTMLSNSRNRILNQKNANDDKSTESKSLDETIEFLNIMSTAQWLEQKTDSSDRVVNHLSDEISHFMVEQSINVRNRNWSNCDDATNESHSITRPQQLAPNISSRNHHSTRAFDLDVEPCLRSICRSELLRSQKERRSSRFYHYLRCANTDSFGTKVLDDHCLVFGGE